MARIAEENPDRELIFLMDAPRRDLYAGSLETSAERWMNEAVGSAARAAGAHFVDLTSAFQKAYARDGERFEREDDYHWNARGHALAARVLLAHLADRPGDGP